MAAGAHKDAALTELGKKQAEALGERFKKDSINSTYGDQPEEVNFKSNFITIIFISWIIFSALIIYFRN